MKNHPKDFSTCTCSIQTSSDFQARFDCSVTTSHFGDVCSFFPELQAMMVKVVIVTASRAES